jgi:hypothetical protein
MEYCTSRRGVSELTVTQSGAPAGAGGHRLAEESAVDSHPDDDEVDDVDIDGEDVAEQPA